MSVSEQLSESHRRRAQTYLTLAEILGKYIEGLVLSSIIIVLIGVLAHSQYIENSFTALASILVIAIGIWGMLSWLSASTFAKHFTVEKFVSQEREDQIKREYVKKVFGSDWEAIRESILGKVRAKPNGHSGEILTPTPVRHHYEFLDLPDGTDATATRTKYHSLMRKCHPDLVRDASAQDKAQRLTTAHKEIQTFLLRYARRNETE